MSEQAKPRFEFGEPCPPIQSWVFPTDPAEKPYPIETEKKEGDEDGNPAQSA